MESLNSLLIIASAFSVFGQYIDNNHRSEYQSVIDNLAGIKLADADHNDGMRDVKERIDDFLAKDCLRATRFIIGLFVYLASVALVVGIYYFVQFKWGVFVEPHLTEIHNGVMSFFSIVLLLISSLMTWRLKAMYSEKMKAKIEVKEIKKLHATVTRAMSSSIKVAVSRRRFPIPPIRPA